MPKVCLHTRLALTALLIVLSPLLLRAQSDSVQASAADSFVDTIGVNVHLHWGGTLYYDNFPLVESRIQQLGIRHLRDGLVDTSWQGYYDHFNALGQLGIKTTFITSPGQSPGLLMAYPSRMANAFEAYEGPNEYDTSGDPRWVSTLTNFQQVLFSTVKNNPATSAFPVIAPSLTSQASYTALGQIASFFDQGNMHDYLAGQNPGNPGYPPTGYGSILWNMQLTQGFAAGKPIISTETGYYTAPTIANGVPEVVAGRYMPRLFLEQFNHGVRRTISYELVDQNQTLSNIESNYGMLHYDGSPKPAFTAVAAMIQLLQDPGLAFSPGFLNFALSGDTANVHSSLFQKRDGSFFLVLWLELPSYDVDTRQSLTVSSQPVTVTVNQAVGMPTVYSVDDTGAITSATANMTGNTLTLSVIDRISIIEFPPAPATVPVTVTTVPSGQPIAVDGSSVVTPQTFNWKPASTHTVSANAIAAGPGERLNFNSWSDGGAANHQITTQSMGSATYTASFTASYSLSASVTVASGGSVSLTPLSPDTYYPANSTVQVSATAAPGYWFYGFGGNLSGTALPQLVTMTAPKTVVAGFSCVFTLATPTFAFTAKGGTGSLSLTSGTGCSWSPISSAAWLQVTNPTGSGSGALAFTVQPNTTSSARSATIIVGGQVATISQSGTTVVALPSVRVNAGGPQYIDPSGNVWSADFGFSGGATAGHISPIANTTLGFLYETERYGVGGFNYAFSVPNGNYTVTLKFAEIYYTQPGKRVFNVLVNGQMVLQSFDICALAGPLTAYDKQVAVTVTNGSINVQLQPLVENPKISAIQILPAN